ncbi:MAG: phosphopyruvate hydratase [Thermoprotei archaeon]
MSTIKSVVGYEVLDSRANPTVYVEVKTISGFTGYGYAPSGASTGKREAFELRDGGTRFLGKGVTKCLQMLKEKVEPALKGLEVGDQALIDRTLEEVDGTGNFSLIGANTATAVSIACFRAAAQELNVPPYMKNGKGDHVLPTPMFNVLNGGKHAGNGLGIQEFMLVPAAQSYHDSVRIAVEVYLNLKEVLKEGVGLSAVNVGDEGGFAPPFTHTTQALDSLVKAVKRAGYEEGKDVFFALDSAASNFYLEGKYKLDGLTMDPEKLLEHYLRICAEYPIISIEDPFSEDDWEGFAAAKRSLKGVRIVGDDLLVTRAENIEKASKIDACNAAIIKINQVGTISRAVEAINSAKNHDWLPIVSHRSGETEDAFISHFATAYSTGAMKSGAPARGERTAKYNELLKIEYTDPSCLFKGISVFKV